MNDVTEAAVKLVADTFDWYARALPIKDTDRSGAAFRVGLALEAKARARIKLAIDYAKLYPAEAADLPVLADLETLLGPGEAS